MPMKKFERSKRGTVMAEAAIILPLFLAILFFVIEYGMVLYLSNSMNQISRSAARFASVTVSYTDQDLIDATMASAIVPDISKLTLTISPSSSSSRSVGTTITVTAQYNYIPIINPYLLLMSGNSWAPTVRSTSVARAEVASAS